MDPVIATHVLDKQEKYSLSTEIMGKPYIAAYAPLVDGEGKTGKERIYRRGNREQNKTGRMVKE